MNTLIGLFLIAHGLIHAAFLSPKPPVKDGGPEWPFDLTKSWLLTPLGLNTEIIKIIGIVLVIGVTLGFVLSGLGWLGIEGLKSIWVPTTIASCALSVILLVVFWHNWLIMAPIIDIVLLTLIYMKDWRPL
jgi:hypothetical protein